MGSLFLGKYTRNQSLSAALISTLQVNGLLALYFYAGLALKLRVISAVSLSSHSVCEREFVQTCTYDMLSW